MDIYIPDATRVVHHTSVDLSKRHISDPIHVVQYDDKLPLISVSIYNDGDLYVIPDDAIINIRYGKPDYTFVYNPALGISEDKTKVYFEITYQMTVIPGAYQPVIEVQSGLHTGGTSSIPVNVDKNPITNGMIESTIEFKLLIDYVNEAKGYAEGAKTSETNAKDSETKAKTSETNAKESEINSATSETNTKGYYDATVEFWNDANNEVNTNETIRQQKESERQANELKREEKYDEMVDATAESILRTNESKTATQESITLTTTIQEKLDNGELQGKSGVWVGEDAPVEEDYTVWIDPEDTDGEFATVAITGSYNDLEDKPTSLPANGGNAETLSNIPASNFLGVSREVISSGDLNTAIPKYNTWYSFVSNVTNKPCNFGMICRTRNWEGDTLDYKFDTVLGSDGKIYTRIKDNSADWSNWTDLLSQSNVVNNLLANTAGAVLDARQGKVLNDKIEDITYYKIPSTLIPEGSDLNSYTTPGFYRSANSTISLTLLNTPYTASGFKFIVEHLSAADHIMQTIKAVNSAYVYYRTAFISNGVWTFRNWQNIGGLLTINPVITTQSNYTVEFLNVYVKSGWCFIKGQVTVVTTSATLIQLATNIPIPEVGSVFNWTPSANGQNVQAIGTVVDSNGLRIRYGENGKIYQFDIHYPCD